MVVLLLFLFFLFLFLSIKLLMLKELGFNVILRGLALHVILILLRKHQHLTRNLLCLV